MKQILNGVEWNFCNHCRDFTPVDYQSNGKSFCKHCCLIAMKDNQWFTDKYLSYQKKDNK